MIFFKGDKIACIVIAIIRYLDRLYTIILVHVL